MIGSLEVRTFEQRFGDRCPFCNRSWGDPAPCGDSRADRDIRKSLALLFADRKAANCQVCDRYIQAGRKFCYDCAASRQAYRNRQDKHRRVTATCQRCGKEWTIRADRRHRVRYCGSTCSNLARYGK